MLTGVDAYTDADSLDSPRVSIFSASGDRPGRRLYVLNNPTLPPTGDINALDSFTANGEVRLSPGTDYYVVFEEVSDIAEARNYRVAVTLVGEEDEASATGWSIADDNQNDRVGSSTPWNSTTLRSLMIGVKGRLLAADPAGSRPQVPVGVEFSEPTYNSLKVSWSQPPGTAVTGYTVQWRKAAQVPEATWTDAGHSGTDRPTATVSGELDLDTAYEARVQATNAAGDRGWSDIATGSTNRRKPDDDIVLHADNTNPQGMWSDGTTLWVANSRTGSPLYRYRLDGTLLTTAMQTFAIPEAASGGSRGVWSDGSTVWVIPDGAAQLSGSNSNCMASDQCVMAYNMSGGRLGPSDIPLPAGTGATALWSDGEILWLATSDNKAIAFDLATRTALSDHDIAFVGEGAGNAARADVWSDGVRMWVGTMTADPSASRVRVYPLDGSDRMPGDTALDLVVDPSQSDRAKGVWSERGDAVGGE